MQAHHDPSDQNQNLQRPAVTGSNSRKPADPGEPDLAPSANATTQGQSDDAKRPPLEAEVRATPQQDSSGQETLAPEDPIPEGEPFIGPLSYEELESWSIRKDIPRLPGTEPPPSAGPTRRKELDLHIDPIDFHVVREPGKRHMLPSRARTLGLHQKHPKVRLPNQEQAEPPGLPTHLITAAQLAPLLGVSLRTVRSLQAQNKIPFYRINTAIRFSAEAVMKALEEMEVKAAPAPSKKTPTRPPARN
jgi:excisionase family DNA binding protein